MAVPSGRAMALASHPIPCENSRHHQLSGTCESHFAHLGAGLRGQMLLLVPLDAPPRPSLTEQNGKVWCFGASSWARDGGLQGQAASMAPLT